MEMIEMEEKPYYCTKCEREHAPLYRGKPSKTYQDHKKYDVKKGPRADKVIVDESYAISEDVLEDAGWKDTSIKMENGSSIGINVMEGKVIRSSEVAENAMKFIQGGLMIKTINRILDGLDVKRARNILKKTVYRPDGYNAIWRLEVWSPEDGKDIPFSIHESQKYKIFIELDKGNKFGRRAKKKWRKYLKENVDQVG